MFFAANINSMSYVLIVPFQFERALVVYHKGIRTRVPLYSAAFKDGVKKTKTAILQSLMPLETAPKCLLHGHGVEGRSFKKFAREMFKSEECVETDGERVYMLYIVWLIIIRLIQLPSLNLGRHVAKLIERL
jgi:hypothetical protein